MKSFVVDASVALSLCFKDEEANKAVSVFQRLHKIAAYVSPIFWFEIANTILYAEQKGRISKMDGKAFTENLKALNLITETLDIERINKEILSLSRSERLTVYDASYLEIALRRDISIATRDKEILAAAKRLAVETIEI